MLQRAGMRSVSNHMCPSPCIPHLTPYAMLTWSLYQHLSSPQTFLPCLNLKSVCCSILCMCKVHPSPSNLGLSKNWAIAREDWMSPPAETCCLAVLVSELSSLTMCVKSALPAAEVSPFSTDSANSLALEGQSWHDKWAEVDFSFKKVRQISRSKLKSGFISKCRKRVLLWWKQVCSTH